MKKINFILILLFLATLSSLITSLGYYYTEVNSVEDVKIIPLKLIYSTDGIGFSVDIDEIHFGKIGQGMISNKQIKLESPKPVLTTLYVEGNIKPFVQLTQNNFVLNEPMDLNLKASVPKGYEEGEYTGDLIVVFRKV